jgi:hypothetical protein
MYGENKTLGARIEVHREINDVMKRLLGRVPDRWLFNYAHAIVESHRSGASSAMVLLRVMWHCLRGCPALESWYWPQMTRHGRMEQACISDLTCRRPKRQGAADIMRMRRQGADRMRGRVAFLPVPRDW